jgi:beta-lactamase class A
MSAPPNDEGIGYGHPPKKTRWKKGQSGNPNRRYPARHKGTVEMIDRLFLKPVEITVNGETKTVSTLEAIVLQLWLKEVSGDRIALNVRLKYQEFARQNSVPGLEIAFVDNEYTRALASANPAKSADHG